MSNPAEQRLIEKLELSDMTAIENLIDRLADRMIEKLDARRASEERAQKALTDEYIAALDSVYVRYPFLDPESSTANQAAVDEALKLTLSLVESGVPNTAAMLQAVSQIAPKYDTQPMH
ncbi:hypothetical protein [Pseudomonas syringae]|uniref:hypothetical protein n=1 Tax=Pseudomonas syringae TaxID=317 RepID=UPI0013725AEE|nr:hypothetical protein [Pseudomonas syringae]NAS98250.1 hypothetical protein [Pseudomonas syringae pv. actinidifoliorum]NAT21584.1 hypothetical protein [Pseudomonas syringae pv. actinidifoliorum]NAT37340.1 hypothetical protein [Pseudomonas syringae pv. actinidifoliorum]NAT61815.1 hypothetical protein [Pseudomonas syringae pv. actinidifoliorum]